MFGIFHALTLFMYGPNYNQKSYQYYLGCVPLFTNCSMNYQVRWPPNSIIEPAHDKTNKMTRLPSERVHVILKCPYQSIWGPLLFILAWKFIIPARLYLTGPWPVLIMQSIAHVMLYMYLSSVFLNYFIQPKSLKMAFYLQVISNASALHVFLISGNTQVHPVISQW